MPWVAIVWLIVGVGASASMQQGKEAADAKAAFDCGRAAHNAGKTDEAVSCFAWRGVPTRPRVSTISDVSRHCQRRTSRVVKPPCDVF